MHVLAKYSIGVAPIVVVDTGIGAITTIKLDVATALGLHGKHQTLDFLHHGIVVCTPLFIAHYAIRKLDVPDTVGRGNFTFHSAIASQQEPKATGLVALGDIIFERHFYKSHGSQVIHRKERIVLIGSFSGSN